MQDPDVKCSVDRIGDLRNNELILECFGHRAAYMVMRALYLRDVEHSSWNSLLVEFYRMSVGMSSHTMFLIRSALSIHPCQELPFSDRKRP